MNTKTLYKSYHFLELPTNRTKSTVDCQKQLTSSHLEIKNVKTNFQNLHEKSEIFTTYENKRTEQHTVEARGLNQDFLVGQQLWNHSSFSGYLSQMSKKNRLKLLIDVFKQMKKWFLIYGLVKFQDCIFLSKKRKQASFSQEKEAKKVLILYLSKKQSMGSSKLTKVEKEGQMVRQFLIMFGKQIFQGQKHFFYTFSGLEEYLEKSLFQQGSSVYGSKLIDHETDFSYKNASMTNSNIDTKDYLNLGLKKVENSMMIIQQNNSELSSPKKFITASGFYEKVKSQNDLLRPQANSPHKNITKANQTMKNRVFSSPVKYKNVFQTSITKSREKSQVKFNYISPQTVTRSLNKIMSTTNLNISQRPATVRFNFISPDKQSSRLANSNNMQIKVNIPLSNRQIKLQRIISNPFSSLSKNIVRIQKENYAQKMKQTATTLNTLGNKSSNYISQHSLLQGNLRTTINSQNFSPLSNSPSRFDLSNKNLQIKDFNTQIRQRKHSQFDKNNSQTERIDNLSGTIHKFNFHSASIFDVQEVEQMNKSDQKFNKIVQESNILTEKNSYSLNEIQNDFDNLFGDDEDSQKEGQLQMMMEEFEMLLCD